MAISEWRTPEENERLKASKPPKRSRTYQEASEEQRRLIDLRKELRAENRRIKAEDARKELWGWYQELGAEGLLADAQDAAERVRRERAAKELRQEIQNQALITEVNQAAGETQMPSAR